MTENLFSISEAIRNEPLLSRNPPLGGTPTERRRRFSQVIVGQWQDQKGNNIGQPITFPEIAPVFLEFPNTSGQLEHLEVNEPPTFASAPPLGATQLQILGLDRPLKISRAELFETAGTLTAPQTEFIGSEQARFVMPVFGERFSQWEDFIAHVQNLYDWIASQVPFDRPDMIAQIALKAQFWPSDPEKGMFNTPDDANQEQQLFYGDRTLAKVLLDPWIKPYRVSLILINSRLRGGAGGMPGYSAWTSITAVPGEEWQAVCVHEIGHGLGLADEYVEAKFADQWPATFEPNVSPEPQPSKTTWSESATLPDQPAPSFTIDNEMLSPKGVVGTFQGARYRQDIYRPTLSCRMRNTGDEFCIVCQKIIVRALTQT